MQRRDALKSIAMAVSAPFVLKAGLALSASAPLPVTVSSYRLDRTEALFDGHIQIEGVAANFVEDAIGDMNTAALSGEGTREVTELGLHPFLLA